MRAAAIFYCFIPWVVFSALKVAEFYGAYGFPDYVFAICWLAISPAVTGMAIFVGNIEGHREARAAIAKATGQ